MFNFLHVGAKIWSFWKKNFLDPCQIFEFFKILQVFIYFWNQRVKRFYMIYNLIIFDVSCSSLRPCKISCHFLLILTVFVKFWLKRTFFALEILLIRLLVKFCVELVSFIDNTLCVGGMKYKKPIILAVFGEFRHKKNIFNALKCILSASLLNFSSNLYHWFAISSA